MSFNRSIIGLLAVTLGWPLAAHAEEVPPRATDTVELPPEVPFEQANPGPGWAGILQQRPRRAVPQEVLGIPIDLDAYFWVDTGYLGRDNADISGRQDQAAQYMQGRFVLGASYTREFGDYFATARAELMGLVNEYAKNQYEPHTLDAYLMIGHQRWWDLQIGRFLGWEVYHRGQGIELFTAEEAGAAQGPAIYLLDYTWGYRNEAGQAALHFYPWEFLSLELGAIYGQELENNYAGARPVGVLQFGDFKAVLGAEYLRQFGQKDDDKIDVTSSGFAGRLQYTLGPVTLGVNGSRGTVEYIGLDELVDTERSNDRTSIGGFANIDFWRNSIGLGFHHTIVEDRQDETDTQEQMFVSYLFRLPIDRLSVKAVYGFASANIEEGDTGASWTNIMHSVRVRMLYELW